MMMMMMSIEVACVCYTFIMQFLFLILMYPFKWHYLTFIRGHQSNKLFIRRGRLQEGSEPSEPLSPKGLEFLMLLAS